MSSNSFDEVKQRKSSRVLPKNADKTCEPLTYYGISTYNSKERGFRVVGKRQTAQTHKRILVGVLFQRFNLKVI